MFSYKGMHFTRTVAWYTVIVLGLFACAAFFFPTVSDAAFLADQLVPCGNDVEYEGIGGYWVYYNECNVCDLARVGMNVLNLLIVICIAVAALLFVNAGFLYITSPANPGNIARAHKLFTNTLIGILLILVAYLFIDTIMRILISGSLSTEANVAGFGPWNEILCEDEEDHYSIKQLDPIELRSSKLVLPKTQLPICADIVPGATCQSSCAGTSVTGTACPSGTTCCVTSGEVPFELYATCGHSSGQEGSCLPWSSCDETAETDTEVCGSELVCCPTPPPTGSYDTTLISSQDAKAQLIAAGIEISGASDGPPIQQGVVDMLILMDRQCGGCVTVTSLSGGDHSAASGHYKGIKADLRLTPGAESYITSWDHTSDRGGSYPGPNYREDSLNINCVKEATHFDCCFNDGDLKCT